MTNLSTRRACLYAMRWTVILKTETCNLTWASRLAAVFPVCQSVNLSTLACTRWRQQRTIFSFFPPQFLWQLALLFYRYCGVLKRMIFVRNTGHSHLTCIIHSQFVYRPPLALLKAKQERKLVESEWSASSYVLSEHDPTNTFFFFLSSALKYTASVIATMVNRKTKYKGEKALLQLDMQVVNK